MDQHHTGLGRLTIALLLLSYENSSLFVDFNLTMCQFSRTHHKEVVNMSWVDWCGKMLKDRKVFLSVLGLNSQSWGC